MSKEQYFENKQSNNRESEKNTDLEKFTPKDLEEMNYYLEVISPMKLLGKNPNDEEDNSV